MTKFNDRHLNAVSVRASSVDALFPEEMSYDVVIVVPSWDHRSKSILNASKIHADLGIIISFTDRDNLGITNESEILLTEFLGTRCENTTHIKGDSRDTQLIWTQLFSYIENYAIQKNTALRILFDISTCPRYYFLGLVAECFRHGIAVEFSCLYAEGEYPKDSPADRHDLFTRGGWDSIPIPGLEGEWDPEKKRCYLVSIGFEGTKTLRLVSRSEPDRLIVLFPDPAVLEGYTERTRIRNKMLFENYPDRKELRASAADAVDTWKILSENEEEKTNEENTFFVCCGTKPQSLGMTLRAMMKPECAVLYIVPDHHQVVETKPSGFYWRYDIRDSTALLASKNQ